MLTFSELGENGRLGNQLFQIAGVIGLADKHGQNFFFPSWKYSPFLKAPLPIGDKNDSFILLKEKKIDYHEWPIDNGNYDIEGFLQSEKYFNIKKTRKTFAFNDRLREIVLQKSKLIFKRSTIFISVRRGDFVRNPLYFQLSYKFYFLALKKYFPEHVNYNIVFASDDITYCKKHYSFLPNTYFLDNFTPIEQLIIAEHCDHFIISNSTFSWWSAWLGEKRNSKIITPFANYRGKFARKNTAEDYFPERWIKFDHRGKTLSLRYFKLLIYGEVGEFKTSIFFSVKKILKKLIILINLIKVKNNWP